MVAKYFNLTVHIVKSSILSAMEYRVSFLMQAFGMAINDVMILSVWALFFSTFHTIRGWSLNDSILLFSFATANVALIDLFAGGAVKIADTIATGELDYYLAFPKNPLWHLVVSRTEVTSFGDFIFAICVFFFSGYGSLEKIPLYLVALVLSAGIYLSFIIITQSITFFVGNYGDAADQFYYLLLRIQGYPQVFYGALKAITFTFLPAFFIVALPVKLIRDLNYIDLVYVFAFFVVIFSFANWFFKKGLKRYESGNLINLRV